MKFKIKETTLTDGSKVFDLDLIANGKMNSFGLNPKTMCIFSCTSEKDINEFFLGLEKLVEKHTLETLEEI